jgi:hypothetical protein
MRPMKQRVRMQSNVSCTFDLLLIDLLCAFGLGREIGNMDIPKKTASGSTGVEPLPKETGTSHLVDG